MDIKDVFVCHASEDKDEIVKPLVESLTQAGISSWYDQAEIKWGDSIVNKVNEGLRISKYVIVVISSTFVQKNWPQKELNAALNMEIKSGEVKVLPLLVGSQQQITDILQRFPLLNDKRYLPWDGNLRTIVESMKTRLGQHEEHTTGGKVIQNIGLRIPLPRIKKKFSQREKDIFLRESFNIVKEYFKEALIQLKTQYKEIDTDIDEVHNYKFVSTIYTHGEIANRCKIWIGGFVTENSIAFYTGRVSMDNDNSFNDMLSVEDNQEIMGFKPMGQSYSRPVEKAGKLFNAEEAAEYLWKRFTDNLGS